MHILINIITHILTDKYSYNVGFVEQMSDNCSRFIVFLILKSLYNLTSKQNSVIKKFSDYKKVNELSN